MKYLGKSFSVGYSSKEYRDNWERIFGDKKEDCEREVGKEQPNQHQQQGRKDNETDTAE